MANRPIRLSGESILKAAMTELVDRRNDAQGIAPSSIFKEANEPQRRTPALGQLHEGQDVGQIVVLNIVNTIPAVSPAVVVLTLALAVGAATAMLTHLAHEGPARIALASLGAVTAAVLFFHTVIDAD